MCEAKLKFWVFSNHIKYWIFQLVFPASKTLSFLAFITPCQESHRACIRSLANNIAARSVLFCYSSFWTGRVFLCGFESLKSVLFSSLKATPGKLSVCSPALASRDAKTWVHLFICLNGQKKVSFWIKLNPLKDCYFSAEPMCYVNRSLSSEMVRTWKLMVGLLW